MQKRLFVYDLNDDPAPGPCVNPVDRRSPTASGPSRRGACRCPGCRGRSSGPRPSSSPGSTSTATRSRSRPTSYAARVSSTSSTTSTASCSSSGSTATPASRRCGRSATSCSTAACAAPRPDALVTHLLLSRRSPPPSRLAFLGTPDAAVPPLRALVDAGHEVALVVTRPDTRRGRGTATTPEPGEGGRPRARPARHRRRRRRPRPRPAGRPRRGRGLRAHHQAPRARRPADGEPPLLPAAALARRGTGRAGHPRRRRRHRRLPSWPSRRASTPAASTRGEGRRSAPTRPPTSCAPAWSPWAPGCSSTPWPTGSVPRRAGAAGGRADLRREDRRATTSASTGRARRPTSTAWSASAGPGRRTAGKRLEGRGAPHRSTPGRPASELRRGPARGQGAGCRSRDWANGAARGDPGDPPRDLTGRRRPSPLAASRLASSASIDGRRLRQPRPAGRRWTRSGLDAARPALRHRARVRHHPHAPRPATSLVDRFLLAPVDPPSGPRCASAPTSSPSSARRPTPPCRRPSTPRPAVAGPRQRRAARSRPDPSAPTPGPTSAPGCPTPTGSSSGSSPTSARTTPWPRCDADERAGRGDGAADGYVQDLASQWVAEPSSAPGPASGSPTCAPPRAARPRPWPATGALVVAADIRAVTRRAGPRQRRRRSASEDRSPCWPPTPGRHRSGPASFDRVLVDAPCSGLGALRRRPDARWRVDPDAVERLAALQARLLAAAADLVRPGGTLVYAVCTLTAAEGPDVAATLDWPTDAGAGRAVAPPRARRPPPPADRRHRRHVRRPLARTAELAAADRR